MADKQRQFIDKIGQVAVSLYPKYKILPSLTIAQAILESNWGESKLSTTCHNYFGMKWNSSCGCAYQEFKTKEQLKNGAYKTITAKFRKYASLEEGIKGYYEFLQYKRYQNLKGVTDSDRACDLIREDGWATSLSYSKDLKRIIKAYGLGAYDLLAFNRPTNSEFSVKTTTANLRIRKGPGTVYAATGKHTGIKNYIIVDVRQGVGSRSGWGKLKSGEGWISLDYCVKS